MRRLQNLFVGVCLASSLIASAVPAKRIERTMTQPDGTQVTLRLFGDEFHHFYLTDDNQVVIGQDNGYYFARPASNGGIEASAILASDAVRRTPEQTAFLKNIDATSLMKQADEQPVRMQRRQAPLKAIAQSGIGVFPGATFPTKGNVKGLIIIVEYKDTKFKISDPHKYFSDMVMKEGFSEYGGTGSARDYFVYSSCGQFLPEFDVYGPITLANNRSYYGGNDSYGNDKAPEQMVVEGCNAIDAEVDFNDYDTDGDGVVDNVYVFYAGQGEASYGAASTVWPHSWELSAAGVNLVLDGVKIDRYACSNEWEDSRPDGAGTFIHEFSHVMGLPDLYCTTYSSASSLTPGAWSVMDYGSYNNDGRTPPAYSAWERNAMGWIEPEVLEAGKGKSVELPSITSSNKACLIPTGKNSEFFMLENRQKEGWDKYIPGHGMLVWHIDYNDSKWAGNTVNNSSSHQYVDIEEANGKANNDNESTMAGYPFPGTANKTSFTDSTTPSMKTWGGKALNTPITNIKESNGLITFDVCGGEQPSQDPDAVATPAFTPAGGSFVEMPQIAITCSTPGAEIRYTLDGTEPDENALLYTAPFSPSGEEVTVKAIAYALDLKASAVATATYLVAPEFTFDFTGPKAYDMELGEYNPDPFECKEGSASLILKGNTRWWATTNGNALRCYKGSSFVVTVPNDLRITGIQIEGTPTDWALDSNSSGSYTNGKWSGTAESVQLNMTKSSGNSSISKIHVFFKNVGSSTDPVTPPAPIGNSLAEVIAMPNGSTFTMASDLVVNFTTDADKRYVYVYDASADAPVYSLIYKANLGLHAGDIIAHGWTGKVSIYKGLVELVPDDSALSTSDVTGVVAPFASVNNAAELSQIDINAPVLLHNVEVAEDTPATATTYVVTFTEASTATIYNRFLLDSFRPGTYDIEGFTNIFNDDLQVYATKLIQFEGVETIEAASESNAEYFNLQGNRVTAPSTGVYIVRRGSEVKKVVIK